MNNIYKVVYGDPSGDGHNITETVYVRCNRTYAEIEELKKKLKELHGIDINSWGRGYGNKAIPAKELELGKDFLCGETEFRADFAAHFALFLLRQIDPSLEFSEDEYVDMPELKLGYGYGFFGDGW